MKDKLPGKLQLLSKPRSLCWFYESTCCAFTLAFISLWCQMKLSPGTYAKLGWSRGFQAIGGVCKKADWSHSWPITPIQPQFLLFSSQYNGDWNRKPISWKTQVGLESRVVIYPVCAQWDCLQFLVWWGRHLLHLRCPRFFLRSDLHE